MSSRLIVLVLAVLFVIAGGTAFAVTEQEVTLTVTIRSLGISVSPASYGFGTMNTGETKISGTALVITNEGNDAEDVGLMIKDEDNWDEWTAASSAGAEVYVLSSRLASAAGSFVTGDILTTSVQWCDGTKFGGGGNDMTAAATVNQWFQFAAPTSVSGDHAEDEHSITVEVSCRIAQ